jgi:hypothetical protein
VRYAKTFNAEAQRKAGKDAEKIMLFSASSVALLCVLCVKVVALRQLHQGA